MKWAQGMQFEKPQPGLCLGRCYQIIDLGTQKHINRHDGKEWSQRDVRIAFELDQQMVGEFREEDKGRPFSMTLGFGGIVRQSLNSKSALYKFVCGWKGKKLSKEEVGNFDPKAMLGKAATLTLELSEDGEYVNVSALAPMMNGQKAPKPFNAPVYFSLEKEEYDAKVFEKLPNNVKEKIKLSPEWMALNGGAAAEPESDNDGGGAAVDEDVPF